MLSAFSTPWIWCSIPRAWKAIARSAVPHIVAVRSISSGSMPQISAARAGS